MHASIIEWCMHYKRRSKTQAYMYPALISSFFFLVIDPTTVVVMTTRADGGSKWAAETWMEAYSSALLEALLRSAEPSGRTVREAADRALAAAASGRTRWSRATLSGLRREPKPGARRRGRARSAEAGGSRSSMLVEQEARVLARLVPGCSRTLSLTALLEEAADYTAALEMQVRAMRAVAEVLSAGGGSGAGMN